MEDVSRKVSEISSFKARVGSTLDKNVAKRKRIRSKIGGRKEEQMQRSYELENVDAPNEEVVVSGNS